ncbi:MAG TPA: CDGSH iron-sulfur domain-containing protein [Gemmatimonadetes bacterium]|nr:CDGSH iron-sulfur domain-containing protein [Gemmatimonadota bacterium]
MIDSRITILKNGPLKVEGGIQLEDHEGTSIDIPTGKAYHLCRCGESGKKPFCDGRHNVCDFDGNLA